MPFYKQILTDGLWHNNPGVIQFLGICPLLAVSNSLVNGIGLGLATTAVLILSNLAVSLLRPWILKDLRLPVFVLIIAALVTCIELVTKAWFFELWLTLGLFLPLIVTNCVILARAESFASSSAPLAAVVDGLAHGLGFSAVLITLGGIRELIGTGGMLNNAEMLLGDAGTGLAIQFIPNASGFLLALLPPGAFLVLALLIALRNVMNRRQRAAEQPPLAEAHKQTANI